MFFLLRGGGGASSGPSAKMILTKSLSTLFVKKKLGWREFQPAGLSGKEKNKKIIEQEDCFIIIVKNETYSNNYALGGHSCIFLAFTSFRNSVANQDKIYHQIH